MRRITSVIVLLTFLASCVMPPQGFAQTLASAGVLPLPGTMVTPTAAFIPAHLVGITIDPKNPLKFDFLIHKGQVSLSDEQKKEEYRSLIKYFLAALTVPNSDQWVNLSPYESQRMIKDNFGKTAMGRDLLAQDYILKQLTASLMNPDSDLGKKFWERVYEQAYQKYGTTDVPVDTFNKVWVVPADVSVFEKDNTALVVNSHLKVMTERDYVVTENNALTLEATNAPKASEVAQVSSEIVRDIIIPQIEQEVNEGKVFANLRQIYSGMILATWFKQQLRESILGKAYADHSAIKGVNQDPKNNEKIYQQYLEAYKKGVVNMIREDVDKYTQEVMPRKYFSGGALAPKGVKIADPAQVAVSDAAMAITKHLVEDVKVALSTGYSSADLAQKSLGWSSLILPGLAMLFALPGENVVKNILQVDVPSVQGKGYTVLRNFMRVYTAIKLAAKHGAEVMDAFENRDIRNKAVAIAVAEDMHEAWLAGERRGKRYVEYNLEIHKFILRMIDAGVITLDNSKQIITKDTFLDPWLKFKFSEEVFDWNKLSVNPKDRKRLEAQKELTRLVNGKTDYVINTIAIDAGKSIDIYRSYGEDKAKRRAERIYDLQRSSEGGALASLFESPDLLEKLASSSRVDQTSAIVSILGNINVFWRVNNPWNTINDLLIHKRFALARDGGIGLQDILKDLIALKQILRKLYTCSKDNSVVLDLNVRAKLVQAFEEFGLQKLLDELAPDGAPVGLTGIEQKEWFRDYQKKVEDEDPSLPLSKAIQQNPGQGKPSDVYSLLAPVDYEPGWSLSPDDMPVIFGQTIMTKGKALAFLSLEQWVESEGELRFESANSVERALAETILRSIVGEHIGAVLHEGSLVIGMLKNNNKNILPELIDGLKKGYFDAAQIQADQHSGTGPIDNAEVVDLKGGIDFNEQYLKMNIQRDGNGVPLPIGQQNLDNIKIDGLVPVILSIQPVTSLPMLSK